MKIEEKLSKIIQCKTISKSGENIKFDEFARLLEELYPSLIGVCEYENYNGLLFYRWKGKDSSNPILFMNHHDVVEAPGTWEHEPFSGKIVDGKVWGRGTIDTKGGLFAMLEAANELVEEGYVPNNDIYFLSDNGEEINGENANAFSSVLQSRGIRFQYVLDEGGMIMYEPIGGAKGTYAMIGVGEKGCSDMKFIARSTGGHASTPPKNTPWIRLSRFMLEVEKSNLFEVNCNDTLQEMFRRLSVSMSGVTRLLLSKPKFFKPLIEAILPNLSPTTNAMLRTTLCFTTSFSGEQLNSVPEVAWVNGNMRFSHHEGQQKSVDELRRIAKKYDIEIEVTDPGIQSNISSYNSDSFRLLEEATNNTYKDVICCPYIMTGASDARFFNRVSDNVYRFVPFIINEQQLESIHGLNENVNIETLRPAIEFYKYLMRK